MNKYYTLPGILLLGLIIAAWSLPDRSVLDSLTYGSANIETPGSLAFGPENLLFVGDSENATVFAIDVNDTDKPADNSPINIEGLDTKLAAALGTTADAIQINDMAVHPMSQNVYMSVMRGQGESATPLIVRMNKEGAIKEVSLDGIRYSSTPITNAPAVDATDRRGRSLRTNTITDLNYADGYVYVAGLSNEEFASSFRKIPFPFKENMDAATLEIFHVAHGQYETHSPIRTFMPHKIDGVSHILAAYTCTPLVTFPVDKLKDGNHVKGKTVAELGFGNSPLDIISFSKEDREYILIANTNRTVMLIDAAELTGANSLVDPLQGDKITAGIEYNSLPMVGVMQLSMLNDDHFLIMQRQTSDGSLRLRSYPISRI